MNNRVQTFSTAPLPLPMSIDVTVQVARHLSASESIRWFPWRAENINPYQIFVAECLLTRTPHIHRSASAFSPMENLGVSRSPLLLGNHVVSEGTDVTDFHLDGIAGEHVAVGALGAHP